MSFRRYLIWIGSEQAKTFGPTISGLIRRHMGRERITIWDSKYQGTHCPLFPTIFGLRIRVVGGRPDTMRLVKEIYASWRAEVVFVTSNPQGNQEIMEGCMELGIPAFVGLPCHILTCRSLVLGYREHCGTSNGG
jgi:hypothetical protein